MTKKRTTIHTLGEVVNLINDLVGDVLRNCPEVEMCALSFAKYQREEKSLYFDLVVTTEDEREFGRKFRIGEEFFDLRFSNGKIRFTRSSSTRVAYEILGYYCTAARN